MSQPEGRRGKLKLPSLQTLGRFSVAAAGTVLLASATRERSATFLAAPALRGAGLQQQAAVGTTLQPVQSNVADAVPSLCIGGAAATIAGMAAFAVGMQKQQTRRSTALQATPVRPGGGKGAGATPEEWISRVKMLEGDCCTFDVTIKKPLGLTPANFPGDRKGVGVARIAEDGNTDKLNHQILIEEKEGMFVLEGDEVVAVNGESVQFESLDKVGPLVKESPGDSVTLTLCRYYMAGPVKVVFLPSGKTATMNRKAEIAQAAKVGVQDVAYSCEEGWCRTCWHTDTMWGTLYRCCDAYSRKRPPPKNPRRIPEKWVNVLPLVLANWEETKKMFRKKKEDVESKIET
eukprot:TRINITY_DN15263_c0_g1_i2.p1 TRINITY_DN15263_c0_g1~~TRINITY_DN15263_c0_g1_i2.p1  ORF type:complete len:347 (-),score=76.51 TRINITY_DN15263_c0_g1_i2:59-1099(-)